MSSSPAENRPSSRRSSLVVRSVAAPSKEGETAIELSAAAPVVKPALGSTAAHVAENHGGAGSERVKSIVFGGLDGVITTFSIVAAVSSLARARAPARSPPRQLGAPALAPPAPPAPPSPPTLPPKQLPANRVPLSSPFLRPLPPPPP
jgi:hypothetical protein